MTIAANIAVALVALLVFVVLLLIVCAEDGTFWGD